MTVTVLYFAAVRELAGRSEERLALSAEVRTLGELARHLEATVPSLAGRLASVRFALNEEFRPLDAELHDGDVVALIPPVAGG